MYDFRGFKQAQDVVKEIKDVQQENVEELKPKKKQTKKKKDESIN